LFISLIVSSFLSGETLRWAGSPSKLYAEQALAVQINCLVVVYRLTLPISFAKGKLVVQADVSGE
jgi:hypothetical protein